jgi:hypothetical protein
MLMAILIEPTIIPMMLTMMSLFFSGIWRCARNDKINRTISKNNSDATQERIDLLLIATSYRRPAYLYAR